MLSSCPASCAASCAAPRSRGLLVRAAASAPKASAIFGIGEKPADETYAEDTRSVIANTRALLSLAKDDPALADAVASMRKMTNSWVAKYRRNDAFTGRASYGNTYSALNAVAGHYNNFGTKYPLPAKRAERAIKELADAELLLERNR